MQRDYGMVMFDNKQSVIDFFNSRSSYNTEGEKHPREAKKLLASVTVKSGQTVLDLATGTGLDAIALWINLD